MAVFSFGYDTNILHSYDTSADVEPVSGKTAFVILGQSNARDRTNTASTDANILKTDSGSFVLCEHFWGLPLASAIKTNLSLTDVYIYWYALGSTSSNDWGRGSVNLNTLFDNYNDCIGSGVEPSFAVYYQVENNQNDTQRPDYRPGVIHTIDAMRQKWGDIPVFIVQMGPHTTNDVTLISEIGRLMADIDNVWICPSHDLALDGVSDVHLSGASGEILGGEYLYSLWRQHVNGEAVDLDPPALASVTHSSGVITVTFSKDVNDDSSADESAYDYFFTVLDDDVEQIITNIERKSGDATSIEITLNSTPTGTITVIGIAPKQATFDLTNRRTNAPRDATTGIPVLSFRIDI